MFTTEYSFSTVYFYTYINFRISMVRTMFSFFSTLISIPGPVVMPTVGVTVLDLPNKGILYPKVMR